MTKDTKTLTRRDRLRRLAARALRLGVVVLGIDVAVLLATESAVSSGILPQGWLPRVQALALLATALLCVVVARVALGIVLGAPVATPQGVAAWPHRTVTRKRRAAYAREVGRRILAPLMYRVAGCLAGLTAILAAGVVLANHALPEQLLWWLATGALSAFVLFAVSAAVVWLAVVVGLVRTPEESPPHYRTGR